MHARLYDLLDRRMRRYGQLAKRETGLHAMWLGWPLLYVHGSPEDDAQKVLAPIFLWPVEVDVDLKKEGRVFISGLGEAGVPRFNSVMSEWIRRTTNAAMPEPTEDQLQELDLVAVARYVQELAGRFQNVVADSLDGNLEKIPDLNSLRPQGGRRIFNSAVLGCLRWQNESILSDLNAIRRLDRVDGVASGFLSGERLERQGPLAPPGEDDRYLVTDADFSQENVIWGARNGPGLVVHGPPGTGKSQTIVNIIADTLAKGQTVLMICQKQAATRVVMERLKKAGIDRLCIEVHDGESDRMAVFKQIREQVTDRTRYAGVQLGRSAIASKIESREAQLDRHAKAFYEPDEWIGLSYRKLLAREAQIRRSFPVARPLGDLGTVLQGTNCEGSRPLLEALREAGHLFRRSRPLDNVWVHRKPEAIPGSGFMAALVELLGVVRAQDEQCCGQIGALEMEFQNRKSVLETQQASTEPVRELVKQTQKVASVLCSGLDTVKAKLERIASICCDPVRPLAGLDQATNELGQSVRDCTPAPGLMAETVDALCQKNGALTELLVELQLSATAVDSLAKQTASEGAAVLERFDASQVVPERLRAFLVSFSDIARNCQLLLGDSEWLRKVVRQWLREGVKVDFAEAGIRCDRVVSLAEALVDYPVDEQWDKACSSLGKTELQVIADRTRFVWSRRYRRLRWFGRQYRLSKRELIHWH
ncbi:MAG: AAA domain-containing protein, partial [Planctomycetota bacterium]|nr:AAA domain-containing protein [Planctomycetota bacterium]